jgi:hypothetical protein
LSSRFGGPRRGKEMRIQAMQNNTVTAVRCTRRVVHGVEIVEKEVMETVKVDVPAMERTRLVITEATKSILAKTRSELAELDSFLRSIFGQPAEQN